MLNDLIFIGDKIDIRPIGQDGKPIFGTKPLASLLVNIEDEETIHISAPILQNKVVFLREGRIYHLSFYTNTGLYQCNCTSLGYYKDNKTVVLRVKLTSKIVKLQRRQYFRLECLHDVKYRILTENEETKATKCDDIDQKNEKIEQDWIKGAIIDISGGGAKLNSRIRHNKGDKIILQLELAIKDKLRQMELEAVVLASEKIDNPNRNDLYEHRVQFSNISQKERDELIKYIFEQERKRIMNEKADNF